MKDQIVQAQVAAIQSGMLQAITDGVSATYDQAFAEGVASVSPSAPSTGSFTQDDVNAAVQKAVADAQAVDAQALADAKAQSDAAMADMQAKFAALSGKESVEAGEIAALQNSAAQVKAAIEALMALAPSQSN